MTGSKALTQCSTTGICRSCASASCALNAASCTNFIYSHMKNEVTKFNTSTRAFNLVSGIGFSREGYPVNSLFSYDFRGLNEDGVP